MTITKAALVAVAIGFTSPAYAMMGDWMCAKDDFGREHCVRSDVLEDQKRPSREKQAEADAALKSIGYPETIVVRTEAARAIANQGWKTTGDCRVVKPHSSSKKLNEWKASYCHLRQHGFKVRKPKVIIQSE